ncbi:MAG: S-layer homology domain-containing protein [Treponematales bacterium]
MNGTTKKNFGKSGRSGAVLTLAGLFIMAMALAFTACVIEEVSNTNTIYSVEVSGTAQVGSTLSAVAKDLWGDEVTDAEFQWVRSDSSSSDFRVIPGATGDSYTLTASDNTEYIKVRATNASSQADWGSTAGWEYSDPVFVVWATPTNATALTLNTWASGNLPTSGDVQWFQFTATASTHYIYFNFGGTSTLNDLYVQVYNGSGTSVHNRTNKYSYSGGTVSEYVSSLTSGQVYYVKVWPYNGSLSASQSGTYQVAFTDSATVPAN